MARSLLDDAQVERVQKLRAQGMKWDDIAALCKRTERTIRLRYEKARAHLRECLSEDLRLDVGR